MNAKPIENFILQNERNLRIAAAVGEAWPEARDRLVSAFLDRLGAQLVKQLKGWKYERWGRYFIDQYPCFYLWKAVWDKQYYVTLQCNNYGEQMVFGLSRDEEHIAKRPFCPEVLEAMKALHPSARARTWWEAWVTLRSPAADWRPADVLWRMHKDREFLDSVAEQLLEVSEAVQPIVDKQVRKGRRK